jgi:hypothetical protein
MVAPFGFWGRGNGNWGRGFLRFSRRIFQHSLLQVLKTRKILNVGFLEVLKLCKILNVWVFFHSVCCVDLFNHDGTTA